MLLETKKSRLILLIAVSSGLILPLSAIAAGRTPQEQQAQQREQQALQQAQQRQGQAQQQIEERRQQADQMRQQADQARQQHDQEMQRATQARQQQEQALRQQEQQAREQQLQGRQQAEQQAHQQQERQVQAQNRDQSGRDQAQRAELNRVPGQANIDAHRNVNAGRPNVFVQDRGGQPVLARAEHPAALSINRVPLEKAIAMPILAPNARPEDREHLDQVQRNLQAHLIAVSEADRPSNILRMRDFAREQYFNNYQATIANQQYTINRQNTFINALEQNQWPAWYQPEPGYQFSNGFTFGDTLRADLNWLRWGWHPYYGPQPEGFVCARDYVPTPWIYIPAYGTWRQPGINAYVPYGPPYDYTGPISVEVFEPRSVNVGLPFGGILPQQVVNVVYFYNAYYFPEYERYGYMNRHGNWIWLNLDTQPF